VILHEVSRLRDSHYDGRSRALILHVYHDCAWNVDRIPSIMHRVLFISVDY
jgi:hypothetical protein